MAHLAEADTNVFNYTGGRIPEDQRSQITNVVVDASVSVIDTRAFMHCYSLVSVQLHDGVVKIGGSAFFQCRSLQKINMRGVRIIGRRAFYDCRALVDVDFGDKLETIGHWAFDRCKSLKHITIPQSVRCIGNGVFYNCEKLTVAEFGGEGLQAIGRSAFRGCTSLTRVAIPAKERLLPDQDRVFEDCPALTTVGVVGGIHKTIASFHLESWKKEMAKEIGRISQILPNTPSEEKTRAIREWMEGALTRLNYYKKEHSTMIAEAMDIVDGIVWEVQFHERNASRLNGEGEPEKKKRRIMSQPDEDGTRGDVWGTKHDVIGHVFSYL